MRRTRPPRPAWTAFVASALIGLGLARGQAPAEKPAASPPRAGDLATRYVLSERYTTKDVRGADGAIGAYEAAFRETLTFETESPQGAPTRKQYVHQVRFAERPAEVSPLDDRLVTDLVRRYDGYRITPEPPGGAGGSRLFEGLTIWYRAREEEPPQIISLAVNRRLLAQEYRFAKAQVYAPGLAFALPEGPVRRGETWRMPRAGASALIGSEVRDGLLAGRLTEIRGDPKGGQVAVLDVAGRVQGEAGETTVRAQLQFQFDAASRPADLGGDVVEARGGIDKLSLTQVTIAPVRRGEGQTTRRELLYERRRPGGASPPALPPSAPRATVENSWLTFADPKGRFHLRYPQEYEQVGPIPASGAGAPADAVQVSLMHRGASHDLIQVEFLPRVQPRPEAHFQRVFAALEARGQVIRPNAPGRVEDPERPDQAIHYAEAAQNFSEKSGRSIRNFIEAYLVHFSQNASVSVVGLTDQDPPADFREQVRGVVKHFRLGPPEAAPRPPGRPDQ